MVQCEPPPPKINPNSLAKDKELTDMVRGLARRFRLRMDDIQQKANDLENATRAVRDRVTCSESKMNNLKNYKTVHQVISTENIPKKEKPVRTGELIMTQEILDGYLAHIEELGKTYIPYNAPPVFTPGTFVRHSDYTNGVHTNGTSTNGHSTNGHATNGYGHAPSTDGSQNDFEDEYESDESEELPVQNGVPSAPIVPDFSNIPAHHFRSRESPPLEPPPIEANHHSDHFEEPEPEDQLQEAEASEVPIAPPSGGLPQRMQSRPPALASVINEMRAKVAAQPRYVDSDSDPDTEPLSAQPSTSSAPRNVVSQEKVSAATPISLKSEETSSSSAAPEKSTRIEQPPPLVQSKPPSKLPEKEKECKVVDNIFDSDSDTQPLKVNQSTLSTAQPKLPTTTRQLEPSELNVKPPTPSAVAQHKLPTTSRQPEPAEKVEKPPPPKMERKSKEKECKVVDTIFDSDSEPEPEGSLTPKLVRAPGKDGKPGQMVWTNLPPKEERGPFKMPPAKATAAKKEAEAKEKAAKAAEAKSADEKKKNPKRETTPKVGKSLFSSDSDSDDEFLKSFSKKKAATPTTSATTTKVASPVATTEPKVVKKLDDVLKVVNAPKATTPSVSTSSSTFAAALVEKVEIKKEEKETKPVASKASKSLFDDSDSDSDLFSSSNKPKLLKTTPVTPVETTPAKMDPPISSEQTEPARPAKKEATSEMMSAKISLIADLQKTFRLPGDPPPSTKKETSSDNETPKEEESGTATILKTRARGPANRRPPTRPNVSN